MKDGDYDWERKGDPSTFAIAAAAEIDEESANDIGRVLEERHYDMEMAQMGQETPFDEEARYEENEADDSEYRENWHYFENNLRTEARFFSTAAEETLADIFTGLPELRSPSGEPVIVEAGPDTELTSLFRARVFQAETTLEEALKRPDLHMGPPPASLAKAGRMNAHGIPVFYGATDPGVATSEVRPPVGSRVIVGRIRLAAHCPPSRRERATVGLYRRQRIRLRIYPPARACKVS